MKLAMQILWRRFQGWIPFLVGAAVLWGVLGASSRVATGDAPHLLTISVHLADLLRAGEVVDFVDQLSGLVSPHPPAGFVIVVLLRLLGFGVDLALAASLVALAITWHGMLLLAGGSTTRRGPWMGGLLLLSTAITWSLAEHMAWDLLAGACVLACLGHLHASDGLRNWGHSLAFGLFMGIGFLTKYTFPVFLLLPTLAAGWAVVRFRSFGGLFVALGTFMVVAGPWLVEHGANVMAYVASSSDPTRTLSDSPAISWAARFAPDNLLYYPTVLRDALGWPGVFVVVAAGVIAWGRPGGRWAALSVISGGVLLTFAGENQARYLFPAIPLLCVLVDIGLNPGLGASASRFGMVLGLGAALPALWGSISTHHADGLVPPTRDQSHPVESLVGWGEWPWPAEAFRPMSNPIVDWKVEAAVAAVAAHTGPGAHTVGVMIPRDVRMPSASTYAWRAAIRNVDWTVASVVADGPGGRPMIMVGPGSPRMGQTNRRFSVAYTVHAKGRLPEPLASLGPNMVWQQELPGEFQGTVLRFANEAWQSELGVQLSKDPMDP